MNFWRTPLDTWCFLYRKKIKFIAHSTEYGIFTQQVQKPSYCTVALVLPIHTMYVCSMYECVYCTGHYVIYYMRIGCEATQNVFLHYAGHYDIYYVCELHCTGRYDIYYVCELHCTGRYDMYYVWSVQRNRMFMCALHCSL